LNSTNGVTYSTHPIIVAQSIVKRYGKGLTFEFSRYHYEPLTVEDHREVFEVKGHQLGPDLLTELFESLQDAQEIAFHSRIILPDGTSRHVPMIDFVSRDLQSDWPLTISILPSAIAAELYIFESGRSYHGYSLHLLTEEEWVSFMGTLLLLNLPDRNPVIDSRWVGHRLRVGFGSLRWSHKTSQYKRYPELVLNEFVGRP
jgi:hypothetical protein